MNRRKLLAVLLAVLLSAAVAAPAVSALEPHGTGLTMMNWLTNDPSYTFSEAYKTSVWYENFSSLELTENDRNNVLRIAVSQLGYHEGDSAEEFGGMNRNGSLNYIEYARLLVPHYNDNAYDWCACFVNWCLNQARFDKASSEIGCWRWVGELKNMNLWQDSAAYTGTYTPKPADMIFFNWKGNNAGSGHIGYVLYTTDTHVFTIEGNADNNVTVRSYPLNDPRVIGYGTPPYEEGNEPTIDYSYKDGMPRGTYVVNSYDTVLKGSPDAQDSICSVPAGSAVVLYETVEDYARVRYGDKMGYISTGVLWLMTPAKGEDTLTFDANGGSGAPKAQQVMIGELHTIPEAIPTLEGDTFLGWSLTPYNAIPDFKGGDPISLAGDTTLYAVWKNRSVGLADKAFSEGKAPNYTRPETITNSAAILPGTLSDLSFFSANGDTAVKLITNGDHGRVLSLISTAKSADPYVTLSYGMLMKSLRLAPVTGKQAAYAVLKVRNISMNDTSIELYLNGTDHKATAELATGNDWQYVVFDLTDTGFAGELSTLRIDWGKTANGAGNTMYLSDICFVSNSEQAKALTEGRYIYPTQKLLEPETEPPTGEPPTGEPTDPETQPEDDPPSPEGETTAEETSAPAEGCFAVVGATSLVGLVAACAAYVALKKRED